MYRRRLKIHLIREDFKLSGHHLAALIIGKTTSLSDITFPLFLKDPHTRHHQQQHHNDTTEIDTRWLCPIDDSQGSLPQLQQHFRHIHSKKVFTTETSRAILGLSETSTISAIVGGIRIVTPLLYVT